MRIQRFVLHGTVLYLMCTVAFLASCREQPPVEVGEPVRPIGQVIDIEVPLGLPEVPVPADNPLTTETIALGRQLFYGSILPIETGPSCANCHDPQHSFSQGQPGGAASGRHTPALINAAYWTTLFWDGRASSLEDVHLGSADDPPHGLQGIVDRLNTDGTYAGLFEKAFGPGPVTLEKTAKAIAAFERTILGGNSAFDRYFYGGDQSALSEEAKLGLEVFRDPKRGNCAACHAFNDDHALFSDNEFHNSGVAVGPDGELVDLGRFEVTGVDAHRGAFRTPSLRNVSSTAPYMHDGSLKDLKAALDFYIGAGNSSPWHDPELHELDFLTGPERAGLLAFLESLTGELPPSVGSPESQ